MTRAGDLADWTPTTASRDFAGFRKEYTLATPEQMAPLMAAARRALARLADPAAHADLAAALGLDTEDAA